MEPTIEINKTKNPNIVFLIKRWLTKGNVIRVVSLAMIVYGLYEAFVGWEQLLGLRKSLHYLFRVTGTFPNPGPYCLFLAVITPLALYNVINKEKGLLRGVSICYLVLSVSLMPVLMGRTGWLAAMAGMAVIPAPTGKLRVRDKRWICICIFTALIAISLFVCLLYILKPASALGRIFLWRMGLEALAKAPVKGAGWAEVPGILGNIQENYFMQHPGSIFVDVAGSPEYAFNEYLQIGIAFGIPALLLFILVLSFSVYCSWKGKEYGIAGSLVAFAVGCLGSYPFKFPCFVLLAAVLMICGLFSYKIKRRFPVARTLLGMGIAVTAVLSVSGLTHDMEIKDDWEKRRYVYQYKLSENSVAYLDQLMEKQIKNPDYLFDYGKALRDSGRFEKSNEVLKKGLKVSADAMFLNLIGRNYQDMGSPQLAEKYYKRSINRLPGRYYPIYLLGKLYSDDIYFDRKKFEEVYLQFMTMVPKVDSPAIAEMRSEMEKIKKGLEDGEFPSQ